MYARRATWVAVLTASMGACDDTLPAGARPDPSDAAARETGPPSDTAFADGGPGGNLADGHVRDVKSSADMADPPIEAGPSDAQLDVGSVMPCDIRGVWEIRMAGDQGWALTDTLSIEGALGAESTTYPATSRYDYLRTNECGCPNPSFTYDPATCTLAFRFWASGLDEDSGECLVNDHSMEVTFEEVEGDLVGRGSGDLFADQFCNASEAGDRFSVRMQRTENLE